jgi:hypothetical protein
MRIAIFAIVTSFVVATSAIKTRASERANRDSCLHYLSNRNRKKENLNHKPSMFVVEHAEVTLFVHEKSRKRRNENQQPGTYYTVRTNISGQLPMIVPGPRTYSTFIQE